MGGGILFLVCLMFLAYSGASVNTKNLPQPGNEKSIFILAGQSNMAGRGSLAPPLPVECQPNPRILRLNAGLTWEEAQDPLHQDIDVKKKCGVGPAMSFANSILEKYSDRINGVVGLVPCAVGQTRIADWGRGGQLYNQLVARARAAGGIIRGMLWYQGESDTKYVEDAQHYKERLETFFKDVRSDLNLPNLPIIQVALAKGEDPTNTEIVRKAQLELQMNLTNLTCIDAKGLTLQDPLHLNTQSQVLIGKMMADAYGKYI